MAGHTRNHSSNAKGSSDSTKARERSKPSQKAMLSKALGKANTAVQLDNAQNYEGAREAYVEACDLLHLVLARTTGEEDRKKLEAIRGTYTSRIIELESLSPPRAIEKRLPARPQSLERAESPDDMTAYDDPDDPVIIETATVMMREDALANLPAPSGLAPSPIPSDSGRSATYNTSSPGMGPMNGPGSPLQSSFSIRRPFAGNTLAIPRGDVMPAPLSPRRDASPFKPPSPEPIVRQDFSMPSDRLAADTYAKPKHTRNSSHESVSWLDPIDESGGSACSSVHSRSSSLGIRRKHIRGASGDTEAEFDAALDAAVEAAYDDGYEPGDAASYSDTDPEDIVANAMRRVELAKERVRQTEREAGIDSDRDWEKQQYLTFERDSMTFGELYDGSESEEEERILDEITREYAMGDFSFAPRDNAQSATTRESNSSGVTSRTWNTSSMGSNAPTSTSVLSTVNEDAQSTTDSMSPPSLPPIGALPQIPSPQSKGTAASVRARRLSGQGAKQLKIETAKIGLPSQMPPPEMPASAMQVKSGGYIAQQRQNLSTSAGRAANFSLRTPGSPVRTASPAEAMGPPPTPPPPPPNFPAHEHDERADSPSSAMPNLRTNFSSSSLKSLRQRQASVAGLEEADLSPNTPLTTTLTNSSLTRQPTMPAVPPTPMTTGFGSKDKGGFGGMQLFDSDFHLASPRSPQLSRSSKEQSDDIPLALEPCPSDVMLRPFWLMRALYQTVAHPRGGYITNRLFVPRDAWKVKGVKLRYIEDKCSQCDLLTAALLKLALVDSNDADAVLEEMQSLEGVLETVQQNLIKKLGSEVGTQGVSSLGGDKDGEPAAPVPRSASVSNKPGTFSWRRLRSKNSAVNLTSAYGAKSSSGGSGNSVPEHKEVTSGSMAGATLPSLPMVAHPTNRPAKRDVLSLKFDGPFAGYMASLARLFDAAQTVDQIARQVDDPGLRHADKTQVGLELCTRHAAEFFSFYICRFVLTDLGMLLDKFMKRASEWALT
ncbi:MIT domain-containing protein [Microdochium nivale]|nr:MIT domain-containing protein [Microdochium nivale]